MIDRQTAGQTAFRAVHTVQDLIEHPQLRTRRMPIGSREVEVPAMPWAAPQDA